MKDSGSKLIPVEIHPSSCSNADREKHLRDFVKAFVEPNHKDRARHIILERPDKLSGELHKLIGWLRQDLVRKLEGAQSFPSHLERQFGKRRGLFIDDTQRSFMVSAPEAATLAAIESVDAILSLQPGSLAIVFHHDCGAWLCKKGGDLSGV